MVTTTQQTCASAHVDSTPSLSPSQRRKLAPNVICMFAEDRPPVVNRKRPGPMPKSIPRLYKGTMGFLRPGCTVEWEHSLTLEPHRVEVQCKPERVGGGKGSYAVEIRFLDGPVSVYDVLRDYMWVPVSSLRRIRKR